MNGFVPPALETPVPSIHIHIHLPQVYPFASSIDVPLPKAPETLVVLRSSCPEHVPLPENAIVKEIYNDQSIEEWHKSRGLWID